MPFDHSIERSNPYIGGPVTIDTFIYLHAINAELVLFLHSGSSDNVSIRRRGLGAFP
jgi:hypothetical protein